MFFLLLLLVTRDLWFAAGLPYAGEKSGGDDTQEGGAGMEEGFGGRRRAGRVRTQLRARTLARPHGRRARPRGTKCKLRHVRKRMRFPARKHIAHVYGICFVFIYFILYIFRCKRRVGFVSKNKKLCKWRVRGKKISKFIWLPKEPINNLSYDVYQWKITSLVFEMFFRIQRMEHNTCYFILFYMTKRIWYVKPEAWELLARLLLPFAAVLFVWVVLRCSFKWPCCSLCSPSPLRSAFFAWRIFCVFFVRVHGIYRRRENGRVGRRRKEGKKGEKDTEREGRKGKVACARTSVYVFLCRVFVFLMCLKIPCTCREGGDKLANYTKRCLCIHVFPAQGKRFGNDPDYLPSYTCRCKKRKYMYVHAQARTFWTDNHSDGFNKVFKPEKWSIIKVFVLYFVSCLRLFIGVVFRAVV